MANFDPMGMVGQIYKGKALGYVVSEKKIFFFTFFHCKYMGANDPHVGVIYDPRGIIGRIYPGYY